MITSLDKTNWIDTEMGLNPNSSKQVPDRTTAEPHAVAGEALSFTYSRGDDKTPSLQPADRLHRQLSPSAILPLFEKLSIEREKFWGTLLTVPFVQDSWLETIKHVASGDLRAGKNLFFRRKLSQNRASSILRKTRPAVTLLKSTTCPETRASLRGEIALVLLTVPMNPENALSFARAALDKWNRLAALQQESSTASDGRSPNSAAPVPAERQRGSLEGELGTDAAFAHTLRSDLQCSLGNYLDIRDLLYQRSTHLANRYWRWRAHEGGDTTDLIQEARVGLLRAIERFDPAIGLSFPAVAHAIMTQTLRDFFRSKRSIIRIRPELRAVVRAAHEGIADETNTRFLRFSEIAERMGVPSKIATPLAHLIPPLMPLDWAQEESNVVVYSRDRRNSPISEAAHAETVAQLRQTLTTLPAEVHRALALKFGIETNEEKTLREIGELLGCSEPTACRLVNRGLSMLRRRMPR